jgi:hypothetical protein
LIPHSPLAPFLRDVLADSSNLYDPQGWFSLHSKLVQAATGLTLTDVEQQQLEAEAQAFRLLPTKEHTFRYTFPELLWVPAGQEVLPPRLSRETIDYWRRRSSSEESSLLRARYADLVWDLERFSDTQNIRDYKMARLAIDGYLDVANALNAAHPLQLMDLLERGLDIAASLRDLSKTSIVIDAILDRAESASETGQTGIWLHPAKMILEGKLPSAQQRERYRLELEKRFAATLAQRDKFSADISLRHLLSFYTRASQLPERHRVLRCYGTLHRDMADATAPLVAVSSLLSVVELFEDNGLLVEADELRVYVEELSPRVEEGMKTTTVSQSLDRAELDAYYDEIIKPDRLFLAAYRLALHTAPKVQDVRARLAHLRQIAPIQFLVHRVSYGNSGLPVTQTGSADENPDAHFSMQYGKELPISGMFFHLGWQKLLAKFGYNAESLLRELDPTPLIRPDRRPFFVEGLGAHFTGDYVKAIHVLVPQVENMLRELLRFLRIPRTKRVRGQPGVTELKNMNDVLRDPRVIETLEDDLRVFLTHLYIDKHSFNLRNDLSHGIAPYGALTEVVSGMVIQSIILLSAIRSEHIYSEEEQ